MKHTLEKPEHGHIPVIATEISRVKGRSQATIKMIPI